MFEKIPFTTTESKRKLSSQQLTNSQKALDSKYNPEALQNTNFMIWGTVDNFQKPPITEESMQKLYYMQDFNVFHYGEGSYTERSGFHSYLLAYTYSGKGSLTYRNRTYYLEKGDGFFIDCKEYHLYKVENKHWDVGILHIDGVLLSDFCELYFQQAGPIFHDDLSETNYHQNSYQHKLENILLLYSRPKLYRDWYVSDAINHLLLHILSLNTTLAAQKTSVPDNIQYLIKYMNSNYTQDLSLDFLSKFSNISKYYLTREFKKYTGFTPYNYLISLRIDAAKKLLCTTNIPISQVGEAVGINDINNFINLFKKRTGTTPALFRNTN